MRPYLLFTALASLSLAACGSDPEPAEGNAEATPTTAEVAEQKKLEAFQDSVEKAMGDIPPELRDAFQTEFACEIERNNASESPKNIDASTIREITARLKAGAASTC